MTNPPRHSQKDLLVRQIEVANVLAEALIQRWERLMSVGNIEERRNRERSRDVAIFACELVLE